MADEQAFPTSAGGCGGMSLRDYFAAQALVAQGTWWPHGENSALVSGYENIRRAKAEHAYAMADAMLEARKR